MKRNGHTTAPLLLIHGGAGNTAADTLALRQRIISGILDQVWPQLKAGESAVQVVSRVMEIMERNPNFNAGLGSTLQSDGSVRLSAALMDGTRQIFSGVNLVTHILCPSQLALALQERVHTVLGPLGAQLLARELGIPPANPVEIGRARKWLAYIEDQQTDDPHGTIGAIAIDPAGRLAAATSTGGSGQCYPDRMSDSATVAGNYASPFSALSATGVGEQIVHDAVCARIDTRVRDGLSIVEASERMFAEAADLDRSYGWIGLDRHGRWAAFTTTDHMPCGLISAGEKILFADDSDE